MEIQFIHFSQISSTNLWAKENLAQFDPQKMVCITADEQTSGYGRLNRTWVSKKGNLHMTLVFPLPSPSLIPNLGQILILSLAKVLPFPTQIKWPNDLLIGGKKISGVLTEVESAVIMGIGVNVNAPIEVDQPTTSLSEVTGRMWDLPQLRNDLVKQFVKDLAEAKMHGFKPFKELFEKLLLYKGEKISFEMGDEKMEAILDSITDDGRLCLKVGDTLLTVSSGDISYIRRDRERP